MCEGDRQTDYTLRTHFPLRLSEPALSARQTLPSLHSASPAGSSLSVWTEPRGISAAACDAPRGKARNGVKEREDRAQNVKTVHRMKLCANLYHDVSVLQLAGTDHGTCDGLLSSSRPVSVPVHQSGG